MPENHGFKIHQRQFTPIERLFARSPFSIVTMVARIRGTVTESRLREAVSKVRQRHPNLRVRISEDENGTPRFTSVTNLTRLDFPREDGALKPDHLIMKPGAGFPLVNVNLGPGAVTWARELNLVLEFVEDNVEVKAREQIRDRALGFLLEK